MIGRNVSNTCNSSGSAIWASAKNIKPLVDANCHTEAMEVAYHQSPIRFSPIHYRNPGSKSRSPGGQTILFGCPPEFRAIGKKIKIPSVLEYLLDSVQYWPLPSTRSSAVFKKQEIVQLTHFIVRWRHVGPWSMSSKKHGQAWRNAIAQSFPTSSRETVTEFSLWFVWSDTPYRELKVLIGILFGPSRASMVR